jgi:acyl-CoA thioester hydrolase
MSNIKIPAITQIVFSTTLDVRISEINLGNHLGHDSLVTLLQEARIRFLKANDSSESRILITQLVVNYLKEAFYGDHLTINIGVGDKSRASMDLIYQVTNSHQEIATAYTKITFFDYQKRKVVRIPEEFLLSLNR